MIKRVAQFLILSSVIVLTGCASTSNSAGSRSRADPWESFNRPIYTFNDSVDRAVLRPVARFYVDHVHEGYRGLIGNFFDNLREPWTAVNQLLQGKPTLAFYDASRFVINSTVGILGFTNLAGELGLEHHREDFGQTLGVWGAAPGPYLVLPLLGPSTVRDTVGAVPDTYLDLLRQVDNSSVKWTLWGTRLIDLRASLLPAERLLDGAALDKYSLIRDGYLQRRRSLVYDGDPPDISDPQNGQDTSDESSDGSNSGAAAASPGMPAGGANQ